MIHAEIYKFQMMHGWVYDSCSKCRTKPRMDDSVIISSGCKKAPEAVELK